MKEKVPFYNIVNMFFVGAVFSLCIGIIFREDITLNWINENEELLSDWSVLISAVLIIAMYEIGFIINRMGSVIIEPLYTLSPFEKRKIFKKIKCLRIWPREEYGIDVSTISKANNKFEAMTTELNLMRSHIMMFVIILIISIVLRKIEWIILSVFLVLLFTLGGRKHNSKINVIRQAEAESKKRATKTVQENSQFVSFKE